MSQHLAAVAQTYISPGTAELIGWGIVILAVLYVLNGLFGGKARD